MTNLRHRIAGIALGSAVLLSSLATAITPVVTRTVSQWAEQDRVVAAESSRFPGPWRNERAPYLVGIMDACGPQDPSQRVTIMGSAQWGKSETALNVVFSCISDWPRPILFYAPTKDKWIMFNKKKIQPTIDASPKLALKIFGTSSRSKATQGFKRFKGGSLSLLSASTSNDLQSVEGGLIICEELTEWELETGRGSNDDDLSRGDPFTQAETRGTTWDDELKVVIPSTPGNKGTCKVTELFMEGTQNYWFWKCPECGDHFSLRFDFMAFEDEQVIVNTPCCGTTITHNQKRELNKAGQWVAMFDTPDNPAPLGPLDAKGRPRKWVISAEDFPAALSRPLDGRDKSFHIWQGISNFSSWPVVWKKFQEAKTSTTKLKAFSQQTLGEAFEAAIDKPDFEKIHEGRGLSPKSDSPVIRGRVPSWACILTTAFDVQGHRLEWATYAYGPFGWSARIDSDVIPFGPYDQRAWFEAARVINYKYDSDHLIPLSADRVGIDTGGSNTQDVYRFVSGHAKVTALKGKPNDPYAPPLTLGSDVKIYAPGGKKKLIGRLPLWLVGTHELKKSHFYGLKQGLESIEAGERLPGATFTHDKTTLDECKQMVAEHLDYNPLRPRPEKWIPSPGPNEQLDLAVYCDAMAINYGISRLDWSQWQELFKARAIDPTLASLTPLELIAAQSEVVSLGQTEKPEIDKTQNPGLAPKSDWMEKLANLNKDAGNFNT